MRDYSNWTLSTGRIAGIPVRLHASLIVGAIFAVYIAEQAAPKEPDAWLYGLLASGIWFASLLIHQMGHLVAAGRIGANVDRIVIGPLGDMAAATVPHEPQREMVVILAGPIAQAVVLLIVTPALIVSGEDLKEYLLSPLGPHNFIAGGFWQSVLKLTFWSNWILFLVNILPALPLDGGRALCCGLRPVLSDIKATAAVARGGLIVTVVGLSIWSFLSQNPNETPLVPIWLPLSLLILYLVFSARNEMARLDDEDRDGDLLGYDFSQGYTSLERSGDSPRRREPNLVQKWLERRREEKRRRAREIEEEEERRVDEILARVKDIGLEALSPEERALLHRVSERYRNRQGHH
jgi:stage IV sporulation protein FB